MVTAPYCLCGAGKSINLPEFQHPPLWPSWKYNMPNLTFRFVMKTLKLHLFHSHWRKFQMPAQMCALPSGTKREAVLIYSPKEWRFFLPEILLATSSTDLFIIQSPVSPSPENLLWSSICIACFPSVLPYYTVHAVEEMLVCVPISSTRLCTL